MHETADFRSDTVTRPTPEMRRAMAEAVVGDDVLGDDPTVKRLEALTAVLFGKEAGLLVPSGTMGNAVCLGAQAAPGEELLAEEWCHSLNFEAGGPAGLWGILTRPLPSDRGTLDPELVGRWIREGSLHTPRTALLAVECTHNFHGGAVVPLENLRALFALTRERGIAMHLDGARVWNAAAATGTPLAAYGAVCDSLSVCLSKGLGAPVGSVVLGSARFIEKARFLRKRLGGGMRQSGVLAAAGIVAVETMRERLSEDHENARRLARGMNALPGVEVDLEHVETNIFFARVTAMTAGELVSRLAGQRVLTLDTDRDVCRFVTHPDVDAEDVDRALSVLRAILRN